MFIRIRFVFWHRKQNLLFEVFLELFTGHDPTRLSDQTRFEISLAGLSPVGLTLPSPTWPGLT